MMNRLTLAVLALALGGCMLESATPLIPEAKSELLLGGEPVKFAMYELLDGNWQKEEGTFTFTPEGKHYRASDGKSEMVFSFMAVSGERWAVQGAEEGKPAAYLIAEKSGDEIFTLPLDCKSLNDAATFSDLVEFKGDNCTVRPDADAAQLFAMAALLPFPHTMKMVRE